MSERIGVLGVGRIGVVTAIGLAHLGHDVLGIDCSHFRVRTLAAGELPEAEPGLRAALQSAQRYRSLRFSQEITVQTQDIVILCVDSPGGRGGAPDLTQVLDALDDAARMLCIGGIVVTRSTVPVGTGDRLKARLSAIGRSDIRVVHMPEFLREGHAWEDFREPDRIVVGGDDSAAVARVLALFDSIQCERFAVSHTTAEFAKYAANAFLATSISFANELGDLCTSVGAASGEVFDILRSDRRIGPQAYLRPGLGFGGHCLPKDLDALLYLGETFGHALPQAQASRSVNRARLGLAHAWLRRELGSLRGRTICIAGLAFKPETNDLRESPSIELAKVLETQGAVVTGWDPLVAEPVAGIHRHPSLQLAMSGADAAVVAHLPRGYDLDPDAIRRAMRGNVIFDPSSLLGSDEWSERGFIVSSIARSHPASTGGVR